VKGLENGQAANDTNCRPAVPAGASLQGRIGSDVGESRTGFLGLGVAVPERVLSNRDLEKIVDTSDEWIVSRTGIRERRICQAGQTTATLATDAARAAIADAGMQPDDIDLILVCTFTPDHLCPSTACQVQAGLGMKRPVPAFDIA